MHLRSTDSSERNGLDDGLRLLLQLDRRQLEFLRHRVTDVRVSCHHFNLRLQQTN